MKSKTLNQSITYILLAGALLSAIPTFAIANEDSMKQDVLMEREKSEKPRPLAPMFRKELREDSKEFHLKAGEAREDIKAIRIEGKEDMVEMRAGTKTLLDAANSREEKKDIMTSSREEMKDKRDSVQILTQEKKEIIRESQEFIFIKRFAIVHAQLSKAISGVESRIQKMSEEGLDVSKSQSLIAEAKLNLSSASDLISKIKSLLEQKPESKEDGEAFRAELKSLTESAKDSLKKAHLNIKEAVSILKEIKN